MRVGPRVPIVASTALGSDTDLHATFAAGFAAHVVEPIEWTTLLHTIERVLPASRRRPPRRSRRPRRRP